ncbi:MAG: alpha/beta hydrolase [Fibrobacter sp.]|nr:alpha/beta hydrolase [Fibrobacter sp.]
MNQAFPKIIAALKSTAFRLLRIAGILCVIYVSMVFYLALTERRNAFPRAIYHKEANEAIQGKAKALTCTLEDGTVLHGFSIGNENSPTLLYYPEADEDAAQFLAQIDSLPGINVVTFNYRGSGENKGTPSAETFEKDAEQIKDCATQLNGNIPSYIAGRGTGAILASQQSNKETFTILIDPIMDIASAIHRKYGFLYPQFLVRTSIRADIDKINAQSDRTIVLIDRKQHEERTKEEIQNLKKVQVIVRGGEPLQKALTNSIKDNLSP